MRSFQNIFISSSLQICSFPELRVCLLQFAAQQNVQKSLNHLEELVEKAVKQHQPHLIALPECFATEYDCEVPFLASVAETINDGQICRTFSALSKKFGVYIVGGTIVERDGDKFYNTATVWNSHGELIARHRKASRKIERAKNEV